MGESRTVPRAAAARATSAATGYPEPENMLGEFANKITGLPAFTSFGSAETLPTFEFELASSQACHDCHQFGGLHRF